MRLGNNIQNRNICTKDLNEEKFSMYDVLKQNNFFFLSNETSLNVSAPHIREFKWFPQVISAFEYKMKDNFKKMLISS